METSIRRRLRGLAITPLVVTAAFLVTLVYIHVRTQNERSWVERSDTILMHVQALAEGTSDAAVPARAYVLGRRAADLAAYERLARPLGPEVVALRRLVADNPTQRARVDALARALDSLQAAFAGVVAGATRRSPGQAPLIADARRVAGPRERVRLALVAVAQAEEALLAERRARLSATFSFLELLLALGAAVAAGVMLRLYTDLDRRLVGRIERLIRTATDLAIGAETGKPLEGDDELARLDHLVRLSWELLKNRETAVGRYRMMVERTNEIMIFSENDLIVEANEAAAAAYGRLRSELLGMPVANLRPPELRAELAERIREVSFGERTYETVHMRSDGTRFPVEVSARAERSADRLAILAIIRDVTETKAQEATLRDALARASEASRLKSEFVATMSHEIRTPLNAILGTSELLDATPLDAEQREYATTIRESGASLLGIVNDVLDFSKIEAGRLELERAPLDLARECEAVARQVAVAAERKGLVLSVSVDPRIPLLLGDALRVRQIAINLLANAVKFTERGSVALSVELEHRDDACASVRCAVADTGIGIAPEVQGALFEAFRQADGSTTRRFGGTGLGLAISRRLVGLMDGEIGLESVPGAGSTFWFRVSLPVAQAPSAQPAEIAPPLALAGSPRAAPSGEAVRSGVKILLAEDNPVNVRLALRQLTRLGFSATVAANGALACEAAQREHFDLILMDLQMPQMDGLAATRAIRERECGGPVRVPIVAMTADALPEDRDACLAAGMDDYLSKPVSLGALRGLLERRLGALPVAEPVPEPTPRPSAARG